MEVHLTPDQDAFIQQRVRNGRFATADDAVREALSLLEERECRNPKPEISSRKSLAQLFAESPFKGLDIKFPRDNDPLRPVEHDLTLVTRNTKDFAGLGVRLLNPWET